MASNEPADALDDSARTSAARAAVGKRIVAALIDLVLLIIVGVVFALAFGKNTTTTTTSNGHVSATSNLSLTGAPFVVYVLVCIAYYLVSEALTGQTLGKALLGLRVVKTDGGRCDLRAAIVRNLVRVIDGLPAFYLIGIISIAVSQRAQRLGDMAAGTLVVPAR